MGPACTWPRRLLALLGSPKVRACTQEIQPQRLGTRTGMGPACLGCRSCKPYSPIRYCLARLLQDFHYCLLLVAPIVLCAEPLQAPNPVTPYSVHICRFCLPSRVLTLSHSSCLLAASERATLQPSPHCLHFFRLRLFFSLGLLASGSSCLWVFLLLLGWAVSELKEKFIEADFGLQRLEHF